MMMIFGLPIDCLLGHYRMQMMVIYCIWNESESSWEPKESSFTFEINETLLLIMIDRFVIDFL